MAKDRSMATFRLTSAGKRLLEKISDRRGISQTGVVEQLVRDEAARLGIRDDEGAEVATSGTEVKAAQ